MYPFDGVLRHVAGHELRHHHEPLAHEPLLLLLRDLGSGPILFRHGSRGKEKQRSLSLKNLSLFRCKENDKKETIDGVRGRKGAQAQLFAFIALRCHNRGGKATVLTRNSKGCSKPMFTRLSYSSHITTTTPR
jgi:hypothetical protein